MDEFMDTKEAAEFIKHSPSTLETWRSEGGGPKWYKPSGKVVYLRQDLVEWVKTENGTGQE